ncbi:MAG: hypothetical protein ABI224_06320 [Acetobacteraceae bacterium]
MKEPAGSSKPFLSDVKTLRAMARQHLSQGAVTPAYGGSAPVSPFLVAAARPDDRLRLRKFRSSTE